MWMPDNWDTHSIVKEVLLSVDREKASSDALVEAGASVMHLADVKWLEDHKVLVNFLEDGKVKITFSFTTKEWLSFTGKEVV